MRTVYIRVCACIPGSLAQTKAVMGSEAAVGVKRIGKAGVKEKVQIGGAAEVSVRRGENAISDLKLAVQV